MSSIPNDPAAPSSRETGSDVSSRPSRLGRGLAGLVGLTQFGPTDEELVASHIEAESGPLEQPEQVEQVEQVMILLVVCQCYKVQQLNDKSVL